MSKSLECIPPIPRNYLEPGSPLYSVVLLEGYVYNEIKVLDSERNEILNVTISTNAYELWHCLRLQKWRTTPGSILYFLTDVKVLPKVYNLVYPVGNLRGEIKSSIPTYEGRTEKGYEVWKWVSPL